VRCDFQKKTWAQPPSTRYASSAAPGVGTLREQRRGKDRTEGSRTTDLLPCLLFAACKTGFAFFHNVGRTIYSSSAFTFYSALGVRLCDCTFCVLNSHKKTFGHSFHTHRCSDDFLFVERKECPVWLHTVVAKAAPRPNHHHHHHHRHHRFFFYFRGGLGKEVYKQASDNREKGFSTTPFLKILEAFDALLHPNHFVGRQQSLKTTLWQPRGPSKGTRTKSRTSVSWRGA